MIFFLPIALFFVPFMALFLPILVFLLTIVFTVNEFCREHKISRSRFYELIKLGIGPGIIKNGRRTLITNESATKWRKQMEKQGVDRVVVGRIGAKPRVAYVGKQDRGTGTAKKPVREPP